MRTDSRAFSHGRSGSQAADVYFVILCVACSAWAACVCWCRKSLLRTSSPSVEEACEKPPPESWWAPTRKLVLWDLGSLHGCANPFTRHAWMAFGCNQNVPGAHGCLTRRFLLWHGLLSRAYVRLGPLGSPRRLLGCDRSRAALQNPDRKSSKTLLEARVRSAGGDRPSGCHVGALVGTVEDTSPGNGPRL